MPELRLKKAYFFRIKDTFYYVLNSLLLSTLPPPTPLPLLSDRCFMTGEGGILTIAGLTSLLGFLKGSLIGLFPKEMDRPLAWAFRCPLINWFVLAIKSFFCSRRSDLREASIAGGQRVEVFKGSRCSRWSCVLTLWCHYTKIFVVCHTRFILLHGQNHGQATHDDDGGGCSVYGTRSSPLCCTCTTSGCCD